MALWTQWLNVVLVYFVFTEEIFYTLKNTMNKFKLRHYFALGLPSVFLDCYVWPTMPISPLLYQELALTRQHFKIDVHRVLRAANSCQGDLAAQVGGICP